MSLSVFIAIKTARDGERVLLVSNAMWISRRRVGSIYVIYDIEQKYAVDIRDVSNKYTTSVP